jgi:hypothetical protein
MCGSGEREARLAPFRYAFLFREMRGGRPTRPRIACNAPSLATLWNDFKENSVDGGGIMKSKLLILLCLLFASAAHAEGCEEGQQQPLTAKEKAFFNSNFKVVRAAVPPPPAGWQYKDDSKEKLAPDYKDYLPTAECYVSHYYVGLDIGYARPTTQAEMDKMSQAMQATPDPAKQKQLVALITQQQVIVQQTMAAAQKQDTKALDALGKQSDALNKQISALQQDMNSGGQAAMEAASFDHDAKVNISINDGSGDVSCYGSPKPLQVPGAIAYQCENPATYSSPGEVLDPRRGRIVVVYGKGAAAQTDDWDRKDAQGQEHKDSGVIVRFQLDEDQKGVVQFVVINIEGDDLARAQSLYKQMNLAPLAALIKK